MRATAAFRQHGLTGWRAVERRVDTAFGSGRNPLRHLGAIAFLAADDGAHVNGTILKVDGGTLA